MVEESASVLTPPGKKMKQARLPFAPVNKQSTEGEEVQRKRKLSDAAAATPEPKTSKIEKLVEYDEVGAEYVKDSTLENNSKSKSETKVGKLKENVCKRTVKDKKAKPEVEVVQLYEDSVQERPETMKGRVKLAFKKNGKKEKKNSEKQADTDSDIELLTGDEREGDGEETSMTEDWAKFHQQEMEKNPGEGHTDKIESLVTPKDEKKHKKPKPVSESTKSEEKPNLEPEPTKPETVTELKTPKGTKSSNNGAKTPKSDSKTAPKANPLAKFLVKMKPGTIPPKTSASAAPITYRKAPKPKAGARPVTTVAGAVSQLKTLQDGGGSESEDEVEGEEIALDDVAASSSEVKKPFHYSDKLSFKNKKLTPRFMKSEEEEEEEEEDDNLVDIEKKFSEINGWLENKTEQGCIRSTEGDRKKTFKCCVCSGEKIFPFRSDLKKHLVHCHLMSKKRESINKKYQCPDCFQLYSTWGNMNAHYREKHTPGRCQHSCNFCDKRFNRQDHFQLHVQSHTKEKSCQCSTCGLKISRPSGLSRHYSNKHPSPLSDECNGRSKQICRFCQEKFKTIALREDHIINYHGAQLDWLKEEKSRKQRDVQAILSLETSEEIEAYPLKKVLKELKKYTCAECGVQYAFPENLQKHARTLHQMMGKGQYTCNYCDEIFGFIYVKQRHMMKKHSIQFPWLQAKVEVVRSTVENILKCSIREDGTEGVPPSIKDGADGVPTSEKTCIIEQDQSHLDPIEQVFVEELNLKTELLDDYPEESQYHTIYNENPNDVEETNIYPENINTSFEETSAFVTPEKKKTKKKCKNPDMAQILPDIVKSEKKCSIEQDQSRLDPCVQVWVEELNLKTELLDDYPEESQYQTIYNENPNDVEEINKQDINTSFEETSAFVSLELLPSKKPKKAKKKKVQDIPAEEEQTPQKKKKKNKKKKEDSWDTSETFVTPEKKKTKKKCKNSDMAQILPDIVQSEKKADNVDELSSKKKKKYSNHHDVDTLENASIDDESEPQHILNNNLLSSNPESVSSDSCSQAGIEQISEQF